MRRARSTIQALLLLLLAVGCACTRPSGSSRPAAWAEPLVRPGLPNLHRVAPELYRGAQPTPQGWKELESLGVKSVLSLRSAHDDDPLPESPLLFERISFKTWHPEDEDVVRFLRFVGEPAHQPVFLHCAHGADRTGTMCAIWRIVRDGWERDEAIREMKDGGYEFHPWNVQLVHYLEETDFDALARQAGLRVPADQR